MSVVDAHGAVRLSEFILEISELATMCAEESRKLENVVELLQNESTSIAVEELKTLQSLDLVIQIQEDISTLLETLSSTMPGGSHAEEVDLQTFLPIVKLGQVKDRLAAASGFAPAKIRTNIISSGSLDLF